MNPRNKREKRIRRHQRVRSKIFGTSSRPRLSVFRSNKYIHLQLIDDTQGKTLAQARAKEASQAATALVERAGKLGIKEAVFDRGGFAYHGKVKLVAETAREAGLKI